MRLGRASLPLTFTQLSPFKYAYLGSPFACGSLFAKNGWYVVECSGLFMKIGMNVDMMIKENICSACSNFLYAVDDTFSVTQKQSTHYICRLQ